MVDTQTMLKEFDRPNTYYEILGIMPEANPKEIKNAYLELAKLYHPDHTHNLNDRRMIELNLIYDVLSHPDKKRAYDEKFAPSTLYDYSQINKEPVPVETKTNHITIQKKNTPAEQKPQDIITSQINYLKIIRIGLTIILFILLFYLIFYLVIKILQFSMNIPLWILVLIPK